MLDKVTSDVPTNQGRRKKVTLVILLAWVALVFTYSLLKFSRLIG